ncbi:MAG: beta-lactamase family protein [Planctomycetes bacterium]|nr:beta-lactamase family protein [Planctomycetota bacterium]
MLSHSVLLAALSVLLLACPAGFCGEGDPFPPAVPETQGLDAEALSSLAATVEGLFREGDITGAELLVVKNRRTVLHRAVGWKDVEDKVPLEPGTIFNIRSMSKALTGTLAQMLIDEGRIQPSDRVAEHLDFFAQGDAAAIQVEHLLTHRSGLPLTCLTKPLAEYPDLAAIAREAAATGPQFPPGSRFQYSDAGADSLGALIEAVAGAPFGELLQRRIFAPLGMEDAYTAIAADDPRLARTSSNHTGVKGTWRRYWKPGDAPLYPFALGSQSVYCTPVEYARFLALWMDGGEACGERILSEEAVTRGLQPVSPFGAPTGYSGLEVRYGRLWIVYVAKETGRVEAFGHSGSDGTYAIAFPESDLMVLCFTQSRGQETLQTFERAVDALIRRPDPEKARALVSRIPPQELLPFLGLYRAALHGWTVELVPEQSVEFERSASGEVQAFRTAGPMTNERLPRLEQDAVVPALDDLMRQRREAHGSANLPALGAFRLRGTVDIAARQLKGEASDLYDGARRHLVTVLPGKIEQHVVIDGEQVISGGSAQPPAPLQGAAAEQARLGSLPALLGDWCADYREVRVLYRLDVFGEDCWVVRTVPFVGPGSTKYVSVDSGLLLAEDRISLVPGAGQIGVLMTFGDYRDVEGVTVPFRWTSKAAHPLIGTIITQFETVETHLQLDAGAFAIPGAEEDE